MSFDSFFLLGWGDEVLGLGCGGFSFSERNVLGLAFSQRWFAAGFASSSQKLDVEVVATKEPSLLASDLEGEVCVFRCTARS